MNKNEDKRFNKNQLVEVLIEDIGESGEGIGKADGYTLFIKDAIVGDKIEALITKAKKNYGYARVNKIISPSPNRVTPRCPEAGRCGGCQIQAMTYDAQLKFKEKKVKDNLVRIGGFDRDYIDKITEPIVGAKDEESSYRYRNKAQFPIGRSRDGKIIAGFYAGRTHSIIPCDDCYIGVEENRRILEIIVNYMEKNHILPYDEASQKGLVRHVLIRKGFASNQIMVCLVISSAGKVTGNECSEKISSLKNQDQLISDLMKIKGLTSICVSVNPDNTNVIMGKEIHYLWGQKTIEDTMHLRDVENDFSVREDVQVSFDISPLSFYQVNPVQVEKLYSIAINYADLSGREELWDLCCGIGTISLCVAKHLESKGLYAAKVHGLEIVPEAIIDAKNNAVKNNIDNAEFICAAQEEYLPKHQNEINADVVIMDPPRKGMDEEALRVITAVSPKRIVYVSCDPATLARDLKYLCQNGYELQKVRPVDMFMHSVHVETVCLLSKLHEAKHHVSVKLDMDQMDLTSAESKATYEEIKAYVAEHNDGMKVSSLNIAQVKAKYGIIERENFSRPKSEDARQPQVTPEKEEAIMKAFRYFGMI